MPRAPSGNPPKLFAQEDMEAEHHERANSQCSTDDGLLSSGLPGTPHAARERKAATVKFDELLGQLREAHELEIKEKTLENVTLRWHLLRAEARQPFVPSIVRRALTQPAHAASDADSEGVVGPSRNLAASGAVHPFGVGGTEGPAAAEPSNPESEGNFAAADGQTAGGEGIALRDIWQVQLGGSTSMVRPSVRSRRTYDSAMSDPSSPSERAHSGFVRHLISSPDSHLSVGWNLFGAVLIFYDSIRIPMGVFNFQEGAFVVAMDWLVMLFWTVSLFLSFLTGYVEDGVTIMVPWKIALHYLRTWFFLDLLVTIRDWVFALTNLGADDTNDASLSLRFLRILRLMRVVRLLRIMKLRWILVSLNDRTTSEYSAILWNIFKMFGVMLLTSHFVSCAWFYVADSSRDLGDTWISVHGFEGDGWFYVYLTAFHWSITQFTPASMHVQPQNVPERLFTIVVVVFALVGFSYMVGSITGSLAQIRSMHEDAAKQFWNVRRYLRQNRVPTALSLRIQRNLEHAWQKQKLHMSVSKITMFSLLSEQLRNELYLSLSVPVLSAHPLFSHLKEHSSITLNRLATTAISRKFLARHDFLFLPGEDATHMYFAEQGRLEYVRVDAQGKERTEHVAKGEDWISEAVLWTPAWVHLGVLNAETECDVLQIDAGKFSGVVRINPEVHRLVSAYAGHFVAWINSQRAEDLSDITQGEAMVDTLKSFIDGCGPELGA